VSEHELPDITRLRDGDALEAALRRIGTLRYHIRHPFHRLLHGGKLRKGQVQAWALNRYLYQSRIPLKDAALIARCPDPALRREWLQRILDHDGTAEQEGGIERWLRLCEGLGLDRDYVRSEAGALPATRFAVEAYVHFVRERSLLEAVASSLTELFAPAIHEERIPGMLAGYPFVTDAMMSYFRKRLGQAPRDAGFALAYVRQHADTAEKREAVCRALLFKCDVLWAQLDALHHAYVLGGGIPPGAFVPEELRDAARAA
jgi:pyrroloquinoline-quinone synthase